MATKKDRSTEDDIAGTEGVTGKGAPQKSTDDLDSFSYDLSTDLDKTTLDLDAFAPYKPSAASSESSDPPLASSFDFSSEPGLSSAEPNSFVLDTAPAFDAFNNSSADSNNASLSNTHSFGEPEPGISDFSAISSGLESDGTSNGLSRLFIQIGKFSAWFDLVGKDLEIGRPDDSGLNEPDISLDFDDAVSRKHGRIFFDGADHYYEDTASTNGTFINGAAVPANRPRRLVDGDVIKIGYQSELTYYK